LNKSELARAVGKASAYITGIENGTESPPSVETSMKIASVLRLTNDETKEFVYRSVTEKIKPEELSAIQSYRAGFLAEQALKGEIHGHISAEAECPLCHKSINIDVQGNDISVTGKAVTKARVK
jgi:transcriptional regulator with XRE-family HTH domain